MSCLVSVLLLFVTFLLGPVIGTNTEDVVFSIKESPGLIIITLSPTNINNTNSTLYYTTDGSTPDVSSVGNSTFVYRSSLSIFDDMTLKYTVLDADGERSDVGEILITVPPLPNLIEVVPERAVILSGELISLIPTRDLQSGDLLVYQVCNMSENDVPCNSQHNLLLSNYLTYNTPFSIPVEESRYLVSSVLLSHQNPVLFVKKEYIVVRQCSPPKVPQSFAFFVTGVVFLTLNEINCPFVKVLVTTTEVTTGLHVISKYDSSTGIIFENPGNYTTSFTVIGPPPWSDSIVVVRHFLAVNRQKTIIARVEPATHRDYTFEKRISILLEVPALRILILNITREVTQNGYNADNSVLYYFTISPGSYTEGSRDIELLMIKGMALQESDLLPFGITGIWEEGNDPVYPVVHEAKFSKTVLVVCIVSFILAVCCVAFITWECRRRIGTEVKPSTYEEFTDRRLSRTHSYLTA